MLFNPTTVVIEHFVEELVDHYVKIYGQNDTDTRLVVVNARNALEIIANSDAPYHDVNHTILVTMVGMEILRGKIQMEGSASAKSWVHFVVSLLHHDIGYVRGICRADRSGRYAINKNMDTVTPPPGATDAFLTPYHVDRAEIYIRERYSSDEWLDVDTLITNIGRTRFPVPSDDDHKSSTDFPGLVRAADLIGQLADPQYFRKIASLYAEFQETGQAAKMGYTTAADLCAGYPKFFWEAVNPYISEGLCYLRRTQEGQTWVANLYANVFTAEHEAPAYGPERRAAGDSRVEAKSMVKAAELAENNQRRHRRGSAELTTEADSNRV